MFKRVHVREALKALSSGEMVVIPTETVYGLAASIKSERALKNIFLLKSRPLSDPLIVHVGNLTQAHEVTKEWSPLAEALAERFWPGPLTLVMEKASSVSPLITAQLNTLALRMPQHPLTLKIINELGVPLAAPSANCFGHVSPTLLEHVERDFLPEMKKLKKIQTLWAVEGGACTFGLESTVLQMKPPFSLKGRTVYPLALLRPGPLGQKEISLFLEKAGFQIQWESKEVFFPRRREKKLGASPDTSPNASPDTPNASPDACPSLLSPGQMESHYAPRIPFVLCRGAPQEKHLKEWADYFCLSPLLLVSLWS